jgi:HemY protein
MKLFRNLLFWIVLALVGALLAQLLLRDPGYVLVRYGGFEYSMTAVSALLIVVVALFAVWITWKLLSLPFRAWRGRRARQSRARLGEGVNAWHHGHYARAEKLLTQAAEDDTVAGAARSLAAQAALARGDAPAAVAHLDALGERHAAARAVGMAELALADGRPTDALVALDAPAAQPLPPRGLALRAQALASSGQAAQAYGLLGPLRQQQALPAAQLSERESQWAEASLREAGDANVLADRWEHLSKAQKSEADVVIAYAERAAALRWDEAAAKSIEQALDARWDERLAAAYGALPIQRFEQRRGNAERWLQMHPASPSLLLTLARLARAQGQWPQAEDYLHRALAQGAGSDAWEEFGHGYAEIGDDTRARQSYANALRAGRGETVQQLGGRDLRQTIYDQAVLEERDEHGMPRLRE